MSRFSSEYRFADSSGDKDFIVEVKLTSVRTANEQNQESPSFTKHIKLPFNICLCRFSWHVTQSKVSQKHANFRTFSSFSCISFELLSFLPSVSKTNVHKLSIPLHLKAIIKIFRSGFWDLWLAIQTCRRGVHSTCKQWPWSLGL